MAAASALDTNTEDRLTRSLTVLQINGEKPPASASPHPLVGDDSPRSDAHEARSNGEAGESVRSPSGVLASEFTLPELAEEKRHLVEEYFRANSTPTNIARLLDIVTHAIVAEYPSQLCRGKAEFFYHLRASFKSAEAFFNWTRVTPDEIEIKGNSAFARWTFEAQPRCCCACCVYRFHGVNEFDFEEFVPVDPFEDENHRKRRPHHAHPSYRIMRVKTVIDSAEPWYRRLARFFCCCCIPPREQNVRMM